MVAADLLVATAVMKFSINKKINFTSSNLTTEDILSKKNQKEKKRNQKTKLTEKKKK